MIIIKDGILNIPECERFVGFTGDNNHTKKTFFIRSNPESGWLYRLYLTFDDGRHNFFTLPADFGEEGTLLEWNIQEDHILKSGLVKAQIKAFSEDNEVYHTTSDVFVAGKTAEEDDEFKNSNSEFLTYEKTLNDLYRKMMAASAKMPYVGENGNWFYYDEETESYIDSGVSSAVGVADGTVTPEKLDRKYLERCVTEYGETISTFAELFEKVGRINRGGNLGFVKLYVSDSDNDTVLNYGYISGDFMAVGTPTNSDICLIDLRSGENWTVSKRDEEKYTAYKVDALTPRVVQLEKNAKIIVGDINSVSELLTYSFSKDYLYHFYATGSLGDLIGEGYCFGRYSTEENPETGELINKFLEAFNFTTLKTWKINFKEATAELVAQGNDEALSKKLEFVRINLEVGSNGDEELKALDINCIGVAGGGKDLPFLFENYTAPLGVEVVEGLQAHVIQFKTYLKGPDIHKRFKRMYAHDGVEPIWSEWEPAEPETSVVTINHIGTMEIKDFQSFSFEKNVLYKFDYYDYSDCLGVYENSWVKFISLRSGKTGEIDTTTGEVTELGGTGAGAVNDIGTMEIEDFQNYTFEEDVWYKFNLPQLGNSNCLGVYEVKYVNGEEYPCLSFINLLNGKTGEVNTTTGEIETFDSQTISEKGTIETEDIQGYTFNKGVLYRFNVPQLGNSNCLGFYKVKYVNGEEYPCLSFINLLNGKTGEVNTTTGEIETFDSRTISEKGTIETEIIQDYTFNEGVLYKFNLPQLDNSDCLGVYEVENIQGEERYILRFVDLVSGTTGEIDTVTGEITELSGGVDLPMYVEPKTITPADYDYKLANIHSNIITHIPNDANWEDLPGRSGITFINFRYTTNYDIQIAIQTAHGLMWQRIVHHSTGVIYRDWTNLAGVAPMKVLAIGDSICYGGRNSQKGFVGDLGLTYKNAGLSSATLSNYTTSVTNIPDQLVNVTDFEPDIIIGEGGINDYFKGVTLGSMSAVPVSTDEEAEALDRSTVIGGLEYLLYKMIALYPKAQRFFLITHKTYQTAKGIYCPTTQNAAGWTQQDLHDAIVECCNAYNVKVIDIYNDSMINSLFSIYRSETAYEDDNSVTNTEYVDYDGIHPLAYGYKEAYIPIILKTIDIGTAK